MEYLVLYSPFYVLTGRFQTSEWRTDWSRCTTKFDFHQRSPWKFGVKS